jgi:trans-2,3-dihydro-3-hydroxyanthranilate isomerase
MSFIAYETVDVFTTTRFGGNPLAVVLDARGLSDASMQKIATEFNYSETTFVLPPEDPSHTARVRIFTPTTEIPFAGHPNVGTAFVLARHGALFGQPLGDQMNFEERAGLVAISIIRSDGAVTGAQITAPRSLEIGHTVPAEGIAACTSLITDDIVVARHHPQIISVGLPFAVAELASREALARAKPDLAGFTATAAALPPLDGHFACFVYVYTPGASSDISARMFAPLDNVLEDPATGSASAALAAFHTALLPEQDIRVELTIEQGVDMGRPSLLHLEVEKGGGTVRHVRVGGSCVPVMRGELLIDSK